MVPSPDERSYRRSLAHRIVGSLMRGLFFVRANLASNSRIEEDICIDSLVVHAPLNPLTRPGRVYSKPIVAVWIAG